MVLNGTSGTFWKFYKNYLLFLVHFVICLDFLSFFICWYCSRLSWFQSEMRPSLSSSFSATTGTSLPSRSDNIWAVTSNNREITCVKNYVFHTRWTPLPSALSVSNGESVQDPLAEVNMFTGMSKFAKIAWSLTRYQFFTRSLTRYQFLIVWWQKGRSGNRSDIRRTFMKSKNKVSSDLFPNTPITKMQSTYFPSLAQLAII